MQHEDREQGKEEMSEVIKRRSRKRVRPTDGGGRYSRDTGRDGTRESLKLLRSVSRRMYFYNGHQMKNMHV